MEIGRELHLHPAVLEDVGEADQRAADGLLERLPLALDLERPGLEAHHVEQVGDQTVHPARLVQHRFQQLASRRGTHPSALVEQGRRGAGDGAKRGAQVVGQRAQQGGPQPLRLDLDLARTHRRAGPPSARVCPAKA
jgi:hypothetical protein